MLLQNLLIPHLALAAYAYVQGASNFSSGNSLVQAFTSSVTAHSTIIVVQDYGGGSTSTISDSAGDTYVGLGQQGSSHAWVWICQNALGGSTTVTIAWTGSSGSGGISIQEYGGLVTSGGTVGSITNPQSAPGTSANAVTSTATSVSAAPVMLWGITNDVNGGGGGPPVAGTGFSDRGAIWSLNANDNGGHLEDVRQTSTGSYALTFTALSGFDNYFTTLLAFQEATAGTCTHSGWSKTGALAVPNGSSGQYWSLTGNWVTPDCSSIPYWRPSLGSAGTN
ncbi:MAG TPA: hypothetical protein VHW25_12650 [Steroidobacteraceae bacterium]|nr:hypothetical protein [Steroidobacteraceae bacterium]